MAILELQPLCAPWVLFLAAACCALIAVWKGARGLAWPRVLHVLLLAAVGAVALGPSTDAGRGTLPRIEIVLDASGSMATERRFEDAREAARLLLEASDAYEGRLDAFAAGAARIAPHDLASLAPDGQDTRIGDALARTLARGDDTLAIVLLSDGANLGGEDPLDAAREAARRRIPLHVIPLGADKTAPDGLIAVPTGLHIVGNPGARVSIPVRVAVTGPAPAAATVQLACDGTDIAAAEVTLANGIGNAAFACELPDAPLTVWTLRLQPLPGETVLANNTATVVGATRTPEVVLLLIEGSPAWEGTHLLRAAARDARIRPRAVRRLTAARPVLHGLAPEALPLGEETLRDAAVHVLGPDWAAFCRDGRIAPRPAATLLLAGAENPHDEPLAWGDFARGTLALTEEGARVPALRALAGRTVLGREIRAPGATPLCTLVTDAGMHVTVCALLPAARMLAFGIRDALRVGEEPFFPALLADAFPALFAPRLSVEHLNYAVGDQATIRGAPGTALTLTGPTGGGTTLTLDGEGRATTRVDAAGLYKLAAAGGLAATFAAQERTAERLLGRPNHDLLAAIAQLSGGSVVPPHPESVAQLRASIERAARPRIARLGSTVWDGTPAFLALAALAALTWWCGRRQREPR